MSPNGSAVSRTSAEKDRLRKERESMKLWIHPITTIKYCGLEMAALFQTYRRRCVFVANIVLMRKLEISLLTFSNFF